MKKEWEKLHIAELKLIQQGIKAIEKALVSNNTSLASALNKRTHTIEAIYTVDGVDHPFTLSHTDDEQMMLKFHRSLSIEQLGCALLTHMISCLIINSEQNQGEDKT